MKNRCYRWIPFPLLHFYLRSRFRFSNPIQFAEWQKLRRKTTHDGFSFSPFDEKQAIFFHIPKCAGTSVANSLFGNRAGAHNDVWTYMMTFSPYEFSHYFKFTFVRNPWDRLVSSFNYLKSGASGFESDVKWADEHFKPYDDFSSFVRNGLESEHILNHTHFVPQHKFICFNDRIMVDFIGRFESLEEDYNYISHKIGVSAKLQHMNRTNSAGSTTHKDYKDYYDSETVEIVRRVYQKDITLFGYQFDNT